MNISVVIPAYNRGAAIQKTVDSALAQDLPAEEFEIIVVDDGSTDDTFSILQSLYGDNPRVRLFSIPNAGVAGARNFGLEKARGEFVAFLDHDDLWLPAKLRLQLQEMERDAGVGLVHGNWLGVDENGEAMPPPFQMTQQDWWSGKSGHAYPWIWGVAPRRIPRNPIISMTVPLMRTELVRQIGGFDAAMVPSDDWDLWIRLSHLTRFAYVSQPVAHYVFHQTQQHQNFEVACRSWLDLMDKHPVSFGKHPFVAFKLWCFRRFCPEHLAYIAAKEAVVQKNYFGLLKRWVRALVARPDRAFQKHWIYLFLRAAKGNTEPF